MGATKLPQILRYGLVSGTCLTLNNAILILIDRLHQPLLVGVLTAFVVVGAASFRLHCRFTFKARPSWLRFARYLRAMAANTLIASALLWAFSSALTWPMTTAAPLASCIMIAVNFLASRHAIQECGFGRPLAKGEGQWAC